MPRTYVAGHVPIFLVIYLFSFEKSKHSAQFNTADSFWEIIYRDYFWEIIYEILTSIVVPRPTKVALDSRVKIQQILFPLIFATVSCTFLYFRYNTPVTLFSLLLASDDTSTSWVIPIVLLKIIQDRF